MMMSPEVLWSIVHRLSSAICKGGLHWTVNHAENCLQPAHGKNVQGEQNVVKAMVFVLL
jgi:hypothetical protein